LYRIGFLEVLKESTTSGTILPLNTQSPSFYKRPPNWKSKNTPEAAYTTTSNDKYHCDYCHKDRHTEDRCYKKKRESGISTVRRSSLTKTTLCIYETALMIRAKEGYVNDINFLADTGATSHMVNAAKNLTDITQINSEITLGTEEQYQCTEK
jgi:hypothetical protein